MTIQPAIWPPPFPRLNPFLLLLLFLRPAGNKPINGERGGEGKVWVRRKEWAVQSNPANWDRKKYFRSTKEKHPSHLKKVGRLEKLGSLLELFFF